jgi:hypothetical protein
MIANYMVRSSKIFPNWMFIKSIIYSTLIDNPKSIENEAVGTRPEMPKKIKQKNKKVDKFTEPLRLKFLMLKARQQKTLKFLECLKF